MRFGFELGWNYTEIGYKQQQKDKATVPAVVFCLKRFKRQTGSVILLQQSVFIPTQYNSALLTVHLISFFAKIGWLGNTEQ